MGKKKKVNRKPSNYSTQTLSIYKKEPYPWHLPVITVILIAALGGGGIWFYKNYQSYQKEQECRRLARIEAAKQAQIQAEQDKKLKEAKWEMRRQEKYRQAYEQTLKYISEKQDKPRLVRYYLLKMKTFFASTEYEKKIDLFIENFEEDQKMKIADVLEKLQKAANAFVERKDYYGAANVYSLYCGDYAAETNNERQKKILEYLELAKTAPHEKIIVVKEEEYLKEPIPKKTASGGVEELNQILRGTK